MLALEAKNPLLSDIKSAIENIIFNPTLNFESD